MGRMHESCKLGGNEEATFFFNFAESRHVVFVFVLSYLFDWFIFKDEVG